MATAIQLPCDGEGMCMRCKTKPPTEETLTCCTCVTPWHVSCLAHPPQTLASTVSWLCPDCSGFSDPPPSGASAGGGVGGDLVAAIQAIEADETLTEREKAKKRQELVSGRVEESDEEDEKRKRKGKGKAKPSESEEVLAMLDGRLICCICMQLLERPVTVGFFKYTPIKCFSIYQFRFWI